MALDDSPIDSRPIDAGIVSIILVPATGSYDFSPIWLFSMTQLAPLTSDTITGTGTLTLTKGKNMFGGFDLNCNGTNAGTLIIRDTDATGKILVKTSSVVGKFGYAPIHCSGTIYYSVSGTGASAFLYEWY